MTNPGKTKRLYNPLLTDFSYEHLDDGNTPTVYTLRSMEMTELPTVVADFMARHLIDEIINVRGVKKNRYDDRIEIGKEVFV